MTTATAPAVPDFTIVRTGQAFTDLRDAQNAAKIGDVIAHEGKPWVRVTSPTRLDFIV